MAETYDLVVIGGGPGGYVAAIRGAQLGMKVACVEREHLGGICLNWGCIPTKALLRSAEVLHLAKNAKDFGLKIPTVDFDLDAIVKRSRGVAGQLSGGIGHLLKKNKVTHIAGEATITGKGKISVKQTDGKTVEVAAKDVIIATGARARELPHLKADGKHIWTYKHALQPDCVPGKLLVIGSGAIGIEFASFFNDLGSNVTVVEMMDRVLPVEDAEISDFAAKAFKKQGLTLKTKSSVTELKVTGGKVVATIDENGKKTSDSFDRVILAIGITGNIENIGLESVGIKTDRGHIVTDEWGFTGVAGFHAIGDVAGAPWLAHKASHEGVIAVEKIKGLKGLHPMDKGNIPGCTYCRPQVASVGMTEEKAKAAGHKVKVGRFPFVGNGKAIALGEPEGLVKTIFDEKTGELLGAHMVGAEVTEMIQGYVVGRTLETTEAELMHTVFPHPTLSEMMHESVLDAYGRAIHF
ncbi:dihydrolipoyl dehydrogenase [Kordiimonas sediminis]|uniref:Dihydrolipoyl dehydrogenase n=1 Tax=Kordiimonas sediminis TaxID=1735581 RepID=A0A919AXL5_9PROT|nr:dihydrolipoyl dehydrogenase [Kordiimonas sediminis]GHF28300.1 dihydrolipoyl dehydrogenase [Kordiimonas sediminis]